MLRPKKMEGLNLNRSFCKNLSNYHDLTSDLTSMLG